MEAMKIVCRMVREYGDRAEEECGARASFHEIDGDLEAATRWRILREGVSLVRSLGLENSNWDNKDHLKSPASERTGY